MKHDDTTTWDRCDNCGKTEQCRFFNVMNDRGGQICVWQNVPPGWMSVMFDANVFVACSAECALNISKDFESYLEHVTENE